MDLLVDTSVLRKVRTVEELVSLAEPRGHRILVPSLVYAERDFQFRRYLGGRSPPQTYDGAVVNAFFARFQGILSVLPLDEQEAGALAERQHTRCPSDDSWRDAKRTAARQCLGIEEATPGKGRGCGAPVDLYLVALASPDRPIVTFERKDRPEWQHGRSTGAVLTVEGAKARLAQP